MAHHVFLHKHNSLDSLVVGVWHDSLARLTACLVVTMSGFMGEVAIPFVLVSLYFYHCHSFLFCHFFNSLTIIDIAGGYLYVDDVLRQQGLQHYTEADVRCVVEKNDKQRFQLDIDAESSRLKIRANQGHTVDVSK